MINRDASRDAAMVSQATRQASESNGNVSCKVSKLSWTSRQARPGSPREIFLITERLAQIWLSNERALAELQTLRVKTTRARAYLASPGCNLLLGRTYLERLETLRRQRLAELRANRLAAWALLSKLDSQCHPRAERQGPWSAVQYANACVCSSPRQCKPSSKA